MTFFVIAIIVGVIGLCIGIVGGWEMTVGDSYGQPGVVDYVFFGFFGFLMFPMVAGLVGLGLYAGPTALANAWSDKDYNHAEYDLMTLNDNLSTTGSFFLGSGAINGTNSYSYYLQNPDGSKTLGYQDASQVKVFDNSDRAYLVYQYDCELGVGSWLSDCWGENKVTEIHVPKGTIANTLVLDAK